MKLGRIAFLAATSLGFVADTQATNGSNYLQLMNGIDFFYGGFYNPQNPPPNVTNGFWRCVPSDLLHSPTLVTEPGAQYFGEYATKIDALHFTSCASTGAVATWPTIALSAGEADCRILIGGNVNYDFKSSLPIIGPGFGWYAEGPIGNGPGTYDVLAIIFNATFAGPHMASPGVALVYGLKLQIQPTFGVESINVKEGRSLTYWIADDRVEGPGAYQYMTGSENERAICSSLSFFASGLVGNGSGLVGGVVFASPVQREWGMFISTIDGTLMAATAPTIAIPGSNTTMFQPIEKDTGTGGLTISMTGNTPEGGNGLGGIELLTFNGYDQGNAFGGSGRIVFASLHAVNVLGQPSCGEWSPGYLDLNSGGGPVLSTAIPEQPRIVCALDIVALSLISNPVWTLATLHNMVPGGNEYPMFPGFPSLIGGSTGNTGGFPIQLPILPQLVGVELCFSGVGLNAANTAIAPVANNGHSHSNSWSTFFFP